MPHQSQTEHLATTINGVLKLHAVALGIVLLPAPLGGFVLLALIMFGPILGLFGSPSFLHVLFTIPWVSFWAWACKWMVQDELRTRRSR